MAFRQCLSNGCAYDNRLSRAIIASVATAMFANMNASWGSTMPGSDEYHAQAYVWIYASPLVFCVGIIGNSLSLIVFRRMGFGKSPTNVYLPWISTADNGVLLLGLLPQWLKQSGFVNLHELSSVTCKLTYFCTFTSGDTAIWLLVAFTIDRAVAVRFPLRNFRFRPRDTNSVRALCMFLLVCACAKNVHIFWTRDAVFDSVTGELISNCGRAQGYEHFEAFVRPWIVFSLVSVVPLIIVLFSNSVIVRALIGYNDRRKTNAIISNVERNFRQTTFMCLAVSLAFFVCVTPNFALLVGRPYWKAAVSDHSALDLTDAVDNLLLYTNHSINFFLYCLTGKAFREELHAMFSRKKQSVTRAHFTHRGRNREVKQPLHQLTNMGATNNIGKGNEKSARQMAPLVQSTKL